METQSFGLNTSLFGNYPSLFVNCVVAVILIYGFFVLINFLRDKFTDKEPLSRDPQIVDLISVLHKLFYLSGFGFVLANILEVLLSKWSMRPGSLDMFNSGASWGNLSFGVILIFIGLAFKAAKKEILTRKHVSS